MTYSIDDEHGTNICGGLSERDYARVAQECANDLGRPVYAYVAGPGEADAECEEFEPEEVAS